MEFVVLGPVQVIGHEGNRVRLVSDAQRRLVGLLVLHANEVVRSEVLEHHLGLGAGALRTSVSRLRRILGFEVLVTASPGYELRTDQVDAHRFERHLAAARDADPDEAHRHLSEALALWHGEAYEDFAHEPWAAAEHARLAELRAGAVEDLVELELEGHRWAEAIAHLDVLIAEEPYRDRPRAMLMRALADSGRQTDALRAFSTYRDQLAEEVGTVPSSALVALDRSIATGEPLPSGPTTTPARPW